MADLNLLGRRIVRAFGLYALGCVCWLPIWQAGTKKSPDGGITIGASCSGLALILHLDQSLAAQFIDHLQAARAECFA